MAKQIILTQNNFGIPIELQFVSDTNSPIDLTDKTVEVAISYDGTVIDVLQATISSYTNGTAYIVTTTRHTSNVGLYTTFWSVKDEYGYITAQSDLYYYVKEEYNGAEPPSIEQDKGTIDEEFDKINSFIESLDKANSSISAKVSELETKVSENQSSISTINNNIVDIIKDINSIDININNINSLQQEIDNTLKKINKFSEIHYINNIADELSILIKCMNGETVLIDCGETFSSGGIYNRLKALGVTKINHFIITHFHSDHVGGYNIIFDNFVVDNVYFKPITWTLSAKEIDWNTKSLYDGFVAKLKQLNIRYYSLTEDTTIYINNNEKIKLMNTSPYPYTDKSAVTNYDVYDYNYESLMCYYTNGTTKVLFQGDCPSKVAYNNYSNTIKNVDHLQITHHGGNDVLNKEWTQSIRPKTGFYTNTNFNTVEHYKTYTMTKLYSYDFNTSNSGCILVTSGSLTPTVSMIEQTLGDRFIEMETDLWVYVDSSGNLVKNGFIENNGKKYIIKDWYLALPSPDGWYYGIENQAYALNIEGSIKCNQWVTTNGNNYYVNDQGIFIKNGIYRVGTTDVTFDAEGHASI